MSGPPSPPRPDDVARAFADDADDLALPAGDADVQADDVLPL